MRRFLTIVALIGSFSFFGGGHATAGLFSTEGLDPAFCKIKTVRQTVVYIDDTMMIDGRIEWAQKISEKLKATLTPGERVAVVRLSAETGESSELWAGCWPNFSPEQREKLESQTYFFSESPTKSLEDQQRFFLHDLGAAFTKVYAAAKRPESEVRFDAANPRKKQILRALTSDDGRFSNSLTNIRAIVYSDLMENSDLGSVYKPAEDQKTNFASRLGSRFNRGIFYAFGVATDVNGGEALPEHAKAFWQSALRSMSASIGGFGADLNVPNAIPIERADYQLNLKFDDQELPGKLYMLIDRDGNLIDSQIGFNRLSISGLTGTFVGDGDKYKLDGSTIGGIATSSPSEMVHLSGSASAPSGELGVQGTKYVFDLTAKRLKN